MGLQPARVKKYASNRNNAAFSLLKFWIGFLREEIKRRERPWKNWTETVKNDLQCLEISWEREEELERDRDKWTQCVTR